MIEIKIPASGMAMTEAIVTKWLRQPGETVEKGEPIVEIETDKANVVLEAPVSGRLGPLIFQEGATVPIGVVIGSIVEPNDTENPSDDNQSSAAPMSQSSARDMPADSAKPRLEAPVMKPELHEDEPEVHRSPPSNYRSFADLRRPPVGELQPTNLTSLPSEDLAGWLRAMLLIREFEAACEPLVLDGKIPGGMHSSAGQEAVAVGTIQALLPTDIVASSHRSHHVSLAKGLTPASAMAELYGKAGGCAAGRGGHMHLSDFSVGLFGSNGIVGGGVGIALGASLASQLRHLDQVAVGFFGDGGASTGRVWEFVNLATIWRLPLIVICENNLFAVETFVGNVAGGNSIADRAAGFGIATLQIDGQDVGEVFRSVRTARRRAVSGQGPTFIEALTYRFRGHNTGDDETYRTRSEVEDWQDVMDPIKRLEHALTAAGILGQEQVAELTEGVREEVAAAVAFAEGSPWPDVSTVLAGVTGLEIPRRSIDG